VFSSNGKLGFIVEHKYPQEVANVFDCALSDKAALTEMGETGRLLWIVTNGSGCSQKDCRNEQSNRKKHKMKKRMKKCIRL